MLGLYIHIPFCISKCSYCDFVSYANCSDIIPSYLEALQKEAFFYKNLPAPQTVYIGGGTPSFLSCTQIKNLLDFVNKTYGGNFKEFTFECNPESLNEEKLKILKDNGINRISIGLQSFNDNELKAIGRAHNAEQFLKAYKTAQKYFNNINVDLIAALPKQTKQSFIGSLNKVIALKPNHISVYGLQVEENTPLYKSGYSYDDGFYVELLEIAYQTLTAAGFKQYEISNYSLAGFESLHNINYWQSGQYIGLGAAAGGFLNGERYCNLSGLKDYICAVKQGLRPLEFKENLTGKAKTGEEIMLALRYLKGFEPTAEMLKFFNKDFDDLLKENLIMQEGRFLKLSAKGKYFANKVFRKFVEPFK